MANLDDLTSKRAALDAEIVQLKAAAIVQMKEQMRVLGITVADLGRTKPAPKTGRPPKYRDADGNTWSGVGKRPAWLRNALLTGATLEQFKVG